MYSIVNILKEAKQFIVKGTLQKNVHLVLGNESCDMDSAISALCLSYFLKVQNNDHIIIPIMNTESVNFVTRTEICFLLEKFNITLDSLTYKNEIDYETLIKQNNVKTTLVDHHVLTLHDKVLEGTVVGIFDHRPINWRQICSSENLENLIIERVGSCCTLIACECFNLKPTLFPHEIAHLLYSTIIYDTIGLNKQFGKTFDKDVQVADKLEHFIKPEQNRSEIFNQLWAKYNDISTLTSCQLLHRDLKVVRNIPIPGVPLLIEDFLRRDDAFEALERFAHEYEAETIVLVGIFAVAGEVKRDLAVFSTNTQLKRVLLGKLMESKQQFGDDLLLEEVTVDLPNVRCFRQGNVKLSRKFIMPIVDQVAADF